MTIIFGPAGSSQRFKEEGHKSTLALPRWLAAQGLQAMEYPAGRGFVMGEEFAIQLGKTAKDEGIALSVHAPYYINLATDDEEKQEKTISYFQEAVKFSQLMKADRIIFHAGGASKGREVALERAIALLERVLSWLDKEDPEKTIKLAVETHGTKNQLGNVDEIIALCQKDIPRMLPVIDWAHLHAVANGGFSDQRDYQDILEKLAKELGDSVLKNLHMHFSSIEYGPSGELRHRTFAESEYGPSREPFLAALIDLECSGRLICECAGTQDVDALFLKKIYESMLK